MNQQLSIHEFIAQCDENIDRLYVDKFWSSISDEKWLYIGDEMLKWMGYEALNHDFKLKQRYLELLSAHFNDDEYKYLTSSQIKRFYLPPKGLLELPTNFNSHNRTMHIIVSPDCFKESLMLTNTSRAKQIRKYYIQVEKIFKMYMRYCEEYAKQQEQLTKHQLLEAQAQLEEAKKSSEQFKMMIHKKSEHKRDSFVYVMSSRNYAKKNLFKIGMTSNLDKRISGYQTGRIDDDKFVYIYIFKCVDGKATEQMIFSRLESFRYEKEKEVFQIHFATLKKILAEFEAFEEASTKVFNSILTEYYNSYTTMPIPSLEDLLIEDIDLYLEDRFDIKPIDRYKPPVEDRPNPLSLTDEEIDQRLLPFGIQLKDQYNGKCDAPNVFQCTSILNHTINATFEVIWASRVQGCQYCRKNGILKQVPIYAYEQNSFEHIITYDTFDDLKRAEPDLNHQLLNNIIREERWLTPHNGRIYSILSPDEGKLNLRKPLSEVEQYIIAKLEIDFPLMRDRILRSVMQFIVAIDDKHKKVYSGASATEFSHKLTYAGSTKAINRKTVAKYLDSGKLYGGYLWFKSTTRTYNGAATIDIATL